MTAPRMVFRSDASATIGWGHVARCVTLAEGLRLRGCTPEFVCREVEGHAAAWIRSRGFPVTLIATEREAWTWEADASATLGVIKETLGPIGCVIVDHYGLDARWESTIRPVAARMMAIDDLAVRPHDVDVLLDQNAVANAERRYDGLVPDACVRLIGPEWALLSPAYAAAHERMPARVGRIGRVLVSFGGADLQAVTTRVVESLLRVTSPELTIDVVVPASSPQLGRLRELAADRASLIVHTDLPSLLPLLALADLSIGASGVTSWERLTMGVPSIVVTLADNQRPIAEELHRRGLVRWLGDADDVSAAELDVHFREVLERDLAEAWSLHALDAVDGHGLTRTLAVLLVDANTPLLARPAGPADEARVLAWANDPGTRRTAFTQSTISADTHRAWFRRRLRDLEACEFFIVQTAERVAVGQVRFERQSDGEWEVHYLVAPAFRGRGLGRKVLQTALTAFAATRGPATVVGRVKSENAPSCRIFEALGFTRVSAEPIYTYQRKDIS